MSNYGTISNTQQCTGACSPFSLSTDPATAYINGLVEEHLNIGAAPINVFKLLGIHEQGKLIDLTGKGTPISSGEHADFPTSFAFSQGTANEWRSVQRGSLVPSSAYIGYDFGPILLDNGRVQYSVETAIKHHITTIKIQQGCSENNRITKARIERSDDGSKWFGVDVIALPNTSKVETISFKQSAPSRYWRIRPIAFNGTDSDYWTVIQLELHDFAAVRLDNIQSEFGFLESRDRSYSDDSFPIKGFYDLQEYLTDLSRFGIDMSATQQFIFRISFNAAVSIIGRPIVIGDIFELPSEAQYTPTLEKVKKYLEVTDVGWAVEGFTPGWTPTIQRVTAMPMMASQETMDIVGNLNPASSDNNFFGLEHPPFSMDAFLTSSVVEAITTTSVPERGTDTSNVRTFTTDEIVAAQARGIDLNKLNIHQPAAYIEDGLPPNGLPFTEGQNWPNNPKDGDYHRLTYASDLNIPVRLHKYSVAKNRWIFVEEDRRALQNTAKPMLNAILNDPSRAPITNIA